MAWDAGLLVFLGLDASSKIGWGATLGDIHVQGRWDETNAHKHIKWKELTCYDLALDELSAQVEN